MVYMLFSIDFLTECYHSHFPSTQDDPSQYLSTEFEQSQIFNLHLSVKSVQSRFSEVLQSSSELHDNYYKDNDKDNGLTEEQNDPFQNSSEPSVLLQSHIPSTEAIGQLH
ncbi:hypothetical protein BpHYR1_025236 [Brachionus plicatilis]|uniref:Uncharacterized protein n=1 Tax=Brachionus plicatilis TaxID=10195 RepID=A0A3M7TAW5_BRAPC|nr:hypothetical protein BpHYR1_025236 [Brachionus plicatilis]